MRRRGAVACLAALALAAGCGGEPEGLPDLTFAALDGGPPLELAELEGPAVVNLWATWCIPCRLEMPLLDDEFDRIGDRVRFVGVNIGDRSAAAAEFVAEVGAGYPQYLDAGSEFPAGIGAAGLPATVFVAAGGSVETVVRVLDAADLTRRVDSLVAG